MGASAERVRVAVIGGGQAGLAMSHELTARDVEHVVLERGSVGQTWRDRWDSFCLVTPNWTVQLPGGAYASDDPDGYLRRDDIVRHLETYAASFEAPVREDVDVTALRHAGGGFALETSSGVLHVEQVIVCSGAYQRPHRPAAADSVPAGLPVIDAEGYSNPSALPPGKVLVVGSGQTGCQISEELTEAGREVFLACGRAPWCTRRIDGRDVLRWLVDCGYYDAEASSLPSPASRLVANVQATGHGGGHDLHYRVLQDIGVTLLGHFLGTDGGTAQFAPDLAESVAFGDARYDEVRAAIRKWCELGGTPTPDIHDPPPFRAASPETLGLDGFGTVIFTCGFRPDYARWIHLDAFDELGFPLHVNGSSTVAPGLHFCGVHFLRKRKSSLLLGVGEDAAIVAAAVAEGDHRHTGQHP
ncbi:MAG: NAD(P)-binding domain-containing protein [Candidatus Dormiibacterota bacterium]